MAPEPTITPAEVLALRRVYGETQPVFGLRLGFKKSCANTMVCRMERGRHVPRGTLAKLLRHLLSENRIAVYRELAAMRGGDDGVSSDAPND